MELQKDAGYKEWFPHLKLSANVELKKLAEFID